MAHVHRIVVLAIDGVYPFELGIPSRVFGAADGRYEVLTCSANATMNRLGIGAAPRTGNEPPRPRPVGGEHLEAAIGALKLPARIVLSGLVSQYNDEKVVGPRNLWNLSVTRSDML